MEKLKNEANGASSQSSVAGNGHIQASGEQVENESDHSGDWGIFKGLKHKNNGTPKQ